MVVCWVERIVNETNRTFIVQPNDPFYRPKIKNQVGRGIQVEVPPGADEQCENVTIPWATAARGGLFICEMGASPRTGVRCVIGPNTTMTEDASNIAQVMFPEVDPSKLDWLRLHTDDWKVIHPDRWMPLGTRHFFGAVGKQVEMQLSFRGAPDAPLEDVIQFRPAVDCLPRNAVLLNVYDLVGELTAANSFLNNSLVNSVGAFHAGVEVYGWEFAFYRTPVKEACGLFRSLNPREHPAHVYRQSINLGLTKLKDWEVRWLIQRLANEWNGGRYDVLTCNCIHFANEFALHLGVGQVPRWVTALHETGAAIAKRLPWLLECLDPARAVKDNVPVDAENADNHDNDTGTNGSSSQK